MSYFKEIYDFILSQYLLYNTRALHEQCPQPFLCKRFVCLESIFARNQSKVFPRVSKTRNFSTAFFAVSQLLGWQNALQFISYGKQTNTCSLFL